MLRLFCLRTTVCAMLIAAASVAYGKPFRPNDPALVLETLPLKASDRDARELKQLRSELAANPLDVDRAVRLARRYYELVAAEGDPRYIGYAQAALSPWWNEPSAPVSVLILRANLQQYRHEFDGALADLAAAIRTEPPNAQAWSLTANIHMVQGRYGDARQACNALRPITSDLIGVGCSALLDALQGKAGDAYAALQSALANTTDASPEQKLWAHTRLGELAARTGNHALAEKHYRAGLSLGLTDGYLLAAYADLLLDTQRPAEVITLLKDMNRSDPLLLRVALAAKALGSPQVEQPRAELASRFVAAALRGDKVHQAEEARFRLHLENDARAALALARENWRVQKETRDARIVLEAAIAAKDPAAAAAVLKWLDETKMEDVVLRRLAHQLRGL